MSFVTKNVVVDIAYDVINGLKGIGRDVFLRLCQLLWYMLDEIKGLIGMCSKCYSWRKHLYFILGRPKKIIVSYQPHPCYKWTPTLVGSSLASEGACAIVLDWNTVFLNTIICEGVFRWTNSIAYTPDYSEFCIGAVPPHLVKEAESKYLGGGSFKEVASFGFWKNADDFGGTLYSSLLGVEGMKNIPLEETKVPNGSFVTLEVDCAAHTLRFFVNGNAVHRKVSGISGPLHLGMSGRFKVSFACVSFYRLPSPTPSRTPCRIHEIRKKKINSS